MRVNKVEKNGVDYVNFVVNNAIPKVMTREETEIESESDEELGIVRNCVNNNMSWEKCNLVGFKAVKGEL